MLKRDGYPAGVPCWVDLMAADLDGTIAFYSGLFGWDFEMRTPPGAASGYAYARLDGQLVAGVGEPAAGEDLPPGWTTYVWVESADDAAAAVVAHDGKVLSAPLDIPGAGRVAVCTDPSGAAFGVWQAAENRGAELVNAPGSWNFSDLTTADVGGAEAFYGAVLGWVTDPFEWISGEKAAIWRVPGYGEFLAERDPELRERLEAAQSPDGFADAVAILSPGATGEVSQWSVIFSVADADAAFSRAIDLGATVVTPLFDTLYTRMGTVADPQGSILTLSQYRPPET